MYNIHILDVKTCHLQKDNKNFHCVYSYNFQTKKNRDQGFHRYFQETKMFQEQTSFQNMYGRKLQN